MSGAAVKVAAGEIARFFTFGAGHAPNTTSVQGSNPTYAEAVRTSFQALLTGTGAVVATIQILGTLDEQTALGSLQNWLTIGTINLNGTNTTTDGFTIAAPWRAFKANVTVLTGTGATCTVLMGV